MAQGGPSKEELSAKLSQEIIEIVRDLMKDKLPSISEPYSEEKFQLRFEIYEKLHDIQAKAAVIKEYNQ